MKSELKEFNVSIVVGKCAQIRQFFNDKCKVTLSRLYR